MPPFSHIYNSTQDVPVLNIIRFHVRIITAPAIKIRCLSGLQGMFIPCVIQWFLFYIRKLASKILRKIYKVELNL
jgi:hypothetical protein